MVAHYGQIYFLFFLPLYTISSMILEGQSVGFFWLSMQYVVGKRKGSEVLFGVCVRHGKENKFVSLKTKRYRFDLK